MSTRGSLATSIFLSLFLIACSLARAEEPSGDFHVDQLDPSYTVDKLKMPGVQIHHLKDGEPSGEMLPTSAERARLAEKAGIADEISSWDHLERDLLFIRARQLPPEKLVAKYPRIDAAKLKEFQRLALALKRGAP